MTAWLLLTVFVLTTLVVLLLIRRSHTRAELLRQLKEIKVREDRLKLCLWASNIIYWDWDFETNVIHRAGENQLHGSTPPAGEISVEEWIRNAIHPDDFAAVELRLRRHISGETNEFNSEHRVKDSFGQFIWVRSRGRIVEHNADAKPKRMAGTAVDISRSRFAEQQLIVAQEALHSINEGVIVMRADSGEFRTVNPAFERMSGFRADAIETLAWDKLGSSRLEPTLLSNLLRRTFDLGAWSGELWLKRKSGEDFFVEVELSLIPARQGEPASIVAVLSDQTDKKRAEIELKHLANFDPLTGLPNRMMFLTRLSRQLSSNKSTGLLFINVDRFMQINESMGHGGGDELLRIVALRIANSVREFDSVARFGGDEFVVMMDNMDDLNEAGVIANRIQKALAEPLNVLGTEVAVTASLGIAISPEHGNQSDQLIRAAVSAMQVVKAMGGDATHLSTGNDELAARERIGMETGLRRALERAEFSLVYQPLHQLKSQRTVRFEALLRWHSQSFGQVSPDKFIPILEQTGLIAPVGEWVLSEALAQLRLWRKAGFDVGVAVNISPIQLMRGDLQRTLPELLQRFEINGNDLEIELTESVIMADPENSIQTLQAFRNLGVSIAIDDFGTGYSSLSYLQLLPIQKLKIDKSFVRDIGASDIAASDSNAITDTILAMAKTLKLTCVAEGVETQAQADYLSNKDCDEIQGFWIAKPMPPAQALEYLQAELAGFGIQK
jgi:diguanylate cyclase (GGDEF)-like protein/PAS domain S-box-containing protein